MASQILKDSILVVAHPDDEVLWFSSILREVNHVVICFPDILKYSKMGEQRIKSLLNYPLQNITSLELSSLGGWKPQSFLSPKFNQYGIELVGKDDSIFDKRFPAPKKKYQENYYDLKGKLTPLLSQYQNVITHNPWGEYGHQDHVQVYRVVNELQAEIGFKLWYSCYCSTITTSMVPQLIHVAETITLPTDGSIAKELMEHYKRFECWTWDDDWCWPAKETFIRQNPDASHSISNTVENSTLTRNSVVPLDLILMRPVLVQLRIQRLLSIIKQSKTQAWKVITRSKATIHRFFGGSSS